MTYRVYVGTYAKYNSGSIKGKWLDLEDYACKQDFYKACAELHSDEVDPEFMFQDHEDIPDFFIGESWIKDEFWPYMDSDIDEGVKAAYVKAKERWDEENCKETYIGEFEGFTELAEDLVDNQLVLGEMPENLLYYFDYEKYGREIQLSGDVVEENGHFFWSY